MKFLTLALILLCVTYGQLIIKFEINKLGAIPTNHVTDIIMYFLKAFTNIGILSGFMAAFIAAASWIVLMSKYELSSVYPFLSLNFVIVPLLSIYLFNEQINMIKIIGIGLICVGVFIFSKGV